jgi:hypothetical protein
MKREEETIECKRCAEEYRLSCSPCTIVHALFPTMLLAATADKTTGQTVVAKKQHCSCRELLLY